MQGSMNLSLFFFSLLFAVFVVGIFSIVAVVYATFKMLRNRTKNLLAHHIKSDMRVKVIITVSLRLKNWSNEPIGQFN